ncbi:hypothetical protein MTO96_043834, partial [Rhipicephalus appendiculatus]
LPGALIGGVFRRAHLEAIPEAKALLTADRHRLEHIAEAAKHCKT